ncbi:hypothetical protein EDC96DRAFT_570175 [Choanephora cucurbitarum]|nr:hypothetical protein EDC96DRAFT_570175 [Choanephora cucurbitarum]
MLHTHSLIIKLKQKPTYTRKGNPAQPLVKCQKVTVLQHSSAGLYHRQPATQHTELCSSTSFLRFAYDFSFGFICSNRREFRLYSTAGSVVSNNSCAVVFGLFFDLEKSPKHGDNNLLVFNEICKSTVADLEEKSESIDEEGHRQKLAIRQSIFESSKTERSRGYGTPQECEACLDMAYMSDDDEVDPLFVGIEDPEVKKAFRVNVSSWRSQLVSTFFWSLDRAYTEQTRTARTKRVGMVSAVAIREEQLNALPSWAKRS